jgi:hypothetical protein
MNEQRTRLLAAASAANAAAGDMIECARDENMHPSSNVASGETAIALVDALRLLVDVVEPGDEETNQLRGALVRFLDPLS